MHITLADELVCELDKRVGPRRRSGFIARAIRLALEDEMRWDVIESSLASIPATGHEWDADPAAWVRLSRRADAPDVR